MAAAATDHQNPNRDDFDIDLDLDLLQRQRQRRRRSYGRYEILNEISRGSYGVVYRAHDNKNEETVAMKQEFRGLCDSTLTEIKILKYLPRHPSIIEFKRVVHDGVRNRFFVVMEYLEYDLKRYIKARNEAFAVSEIRYLMKQLLEGVAFLHKQGVMHRDLKPANILINSKAQLKICDFGCSAPLRDREYSPRVGTRWYRAPELLRGSRSYSSAVDMWSVGCIMGELVLNRPLFPGESNDHQLPCIHQVMGLPLKMPSLTRSGVDLLQRLLAYHPHNRITARDALNHAWFTEQLL
ncbi:hypothetical protein C2S53_001062 [Perilla frutescens var. hirtella]|uniref:Protein kinase domain-containing protein n=1 Tax=Perilla frutescens var. hirtella TaxID=608512 RepID=A0AAD4JNT9_PERFH|nr:hypothetical protein C2S53_001062 [Perilla frutescens var. hirtella]